MTCKLLSLLFCMMFLFSNAFAEEPAAEPGVFTDVVILSTTDMHGKCWNTNILTGAAEKNNMLRVSTVVKQFREDYGAENVRSPRFSCSCVPPENPQTSLPWLYA